jgi:hypothetical protein
MPGVWVWPSLYNCTVLGECQAIGGQVGGLLLSGLHQCILYVSVMPGGGGLAVFLHTLLLVFIGTKVLINIIQAFSLKVPSYQIGSA